MSATLATPDVHQLADEHLPRSGFPASPKADFRVHFAPAAHEAIWKHANENRAVEICGVLVGRFEQDDDGPFVSVTNSIRCDEATSKFAEVTFTHESWARINAEMDTKYADRRIVGWYHTHPDFGIFLSDRDTFIHQNFFSNPGQIAHVVDPVRQVEGVFTWRRGKPVACSHFWVGDRICLDGSADRADAMRPRSEAAGDGAVGTRRESSPPVRDDESLGSIVRAALPLVVMFLAGYLLSGLITGWRSGAERNRMFRHALTELEYWKHLRPGLTEQLETIDRRLDAAAARVQDLAGEHIRLAGDNSAERRSEWTKVLNTLRDARQLARDARLAYGLTAEESAMLEDILRRQSERAGESGGEQDDRRKTDVQEIPKRE